MVQYQNTLLQEAGKLAIEDTNLASSVARLSGDLYTIAQGFVKDIIPANYPSWCRPVFLGESAYIGNVAKTGYRIADYVYDSDYMQRVAHVPRDGSILCCLTKDLPAGRITLKLLDENNRKGAEVWEIWQVPKANTPALKWYTIDYNGFGMHGPPVLFNPHPKGPRDVNYESWDIKYYETKLVLVEAGSTNVLACDRTAISPSRYKAGDANAQWCFL
jgi:hypothetical protein